MGTHFWLPSDAFNCRFQVHNSNLDETLQERVVPSRNRRNLRGMKRKMSKFPLRPRHAPPQPPISIGKAISIMK